MTKRNNSPTTISTQLPFHPFADLFPVLSGRAFQDMCRDIELKGLLDEIVRYEGHILEGRTRYLACNKVGVEPRFREWNGEGGDPLSFVISKNQRRRHLSKSQAALAAAKALPFFETEATERKKAGSSRGGQGKAKKNGSSPSRRKARDDAAKAFGVSSRLVQDAKTVLKLVDGTQLSVKVLREVERGSRTLNEVLTEHRTRLKAREAAARARQAAAGQLEPVLISPTGPSTEPATEAPSATSSRSQARQRATPSRGAAKGRNGASQQSVGRRSLVDPQTGQLPWLHKESPEVEVERLTYELLGALLRRREDPALPQGLQDVLDRMAPLVREALELVQAYEGGE